MYNPIEILFESHNIQPEPQIIKKNVNIRAVTNTVGEMFESIVVAAKHYHIVPTSISYALKHNTKCQGMKWSYV